MTADRPRPRRRPARYANVRTASATAPATTAACGTAALAVASPSPDSRVNAACRSSRADPVPVRRYCHQRVLPSFSGLVSGRRRAAGPLATRHAARPMTSSAATATMTYGSHVQVAGERRSRLGLQEPEEADEQQDEPDAERQRAGDAEGQEAADALERPDRLLLDVVDDELDGVAARLPDPVGRALGAAIGPGPVEQLHRVILPPGAADRKQWPAGAAMRRKGPGEMGRVKRMSGPAPLPADDHAAGAGDAGLEQLSINVVRGLAMDAPRAANSGHSGTAMALAPLAYVLWTRVMRHDPADPAWPDRDRFVLSNGHASILLYSMLYLTGYGLTLDDLKAFRQWGSKTPGHPEHRHTAGVEVTTGPLGQGFANGVGMGVAERFLRAKFGPDVVDHHTFVICRRRLLGGGDLARGRVARRPPPARPARLRLRRQPHHDRRADGAVVHRPRPGAVRRLRLGRRRRRRGRQRHDSPRSRGPPGDGRRGQAVADRPAQPHRLAVAEPDGHGEGPRRPVPAGRDPGDEGAPRAAAGRDVLGARRGARPLPGVRATRPGAARRVAGPLRRWGGDRAAWDAAWAGPGPARLGGEAADVRGRRPSWRRARRSTHASTPPPTCCPASSPARPT